MGIRRLCFYELSAQVEAWLLWALRGERVSLVKASPTLRPQGLLSKRRLREVLSAAQETDPKGFCLARARGASTAAWRGADCVLFGERGGECGGGDGASAAGDR